MTFALANWRVITVVSWLLAAALYLTLPPSSAQMNHAYIGWRLLEGDVPYRDFIDMNWPGVMAIHALANWLFGLHMWSFRATDFLCFALATVFLFDLVRKAAGPDASKAVLICAPLIYVGAGHSLSGEHDMTAAQFALVSVWFHVRGYTRGISWQLGTGVALGIALLNKPPVAVLGLLMPLQAIFVGVSLRTAFAHSAVMALTAAGTAALAIIAVLATGVSLSEVIESTYIYNAMTRHLGALPVVEWINPARSLSFVVATIAGIPAFIWLLTRSNRNVASTALPLLWVAGLMSYMIHARAAAYNLAPAFLALIGMLAISVEVIRSNRFSIGWHWLDQVLKHAFVPLAIAGILVKLMSLYWSLPVALATGDFNKHISRFYAGDQLNYTEVFEFEKRLGTDSADHCILAVGEQSAINYLLHKPQPTRFYYISMLMDAREDANPKLPMADRWIAQWEKEMQSRKCRFVLVAGWVHNRILSQKTRVAVALHELLAGYRNVGAIGSRGYIDVYEKKD